MRQVINEGFDRRYVLLPLLAAIAVVVVAFFVSESRRSYTRDLSEAILQSQDRMREIAEIGRRYHGLLDRNHLSFQMREFVGRFSQPRLQRLGRRVVDGLCDRCFGWDGYMVRDWPPQ